MSLYFTLPEGMGMNAVYEGLILTTCFGKDSGRRVLGIIGGGGSRVASAAGLAAGLQDLKVHQGFSVLILGSAGAIVGALMAANQAHLAAEGFPAICGHRSFIRLHRRGAVNIGRMEKALRGKTHGGRFRLDVDAVRSSPMEMYVVVATREGKVEYLSLKELPDVVDGVVAAASLPGWLWGKTKRIGGKDYGDGAILDPLPTEWVKENLKPTEIAWFPNQELPLPREVVANGGPITLKQKRDMLLSKFLEFLVRNVALWGHPKRFRMLARQARALLQRRLEDAMYDAEIPLSILPTPPMGLSVNPFTTDPRKLQLAVMFGRSAIHRQFHHFRQSILSLEPLREEDPEALLERFRLKYQFPKGPLA